MKKLLIQYIWLFIIAGIIIVVAYNVNNDSKNPFFFIPGVDIDKKIQEKKEEQKILSETEKDLVKENEEKEWEEVDKETNK